MEGETSTGLKENIAGLLCYLVGWVTGLIFLLLEQDNRFVRFHALQSIVVFGTITVISIVLSILTALSMAISPLGIINAVLGIISTLIWLFALALWIVLMVKAYQGETFELPWAGDIAKRHL